MAVCLLSLLAIKNRQEAEWKNALLITAEIYNKYLHPSDKSNRSIFGDGVAASLISTEGIAEIGDLVLLVLMEVTQSILSLEHV